MFDLENKDYFSIVSSLKKFSSNEAKKYNISVLRNITLEPFLDTYLKRFLIELGFNGNIIYGEYDNIFEETISGDSKLFNETTDFIVIFLHLESLSSILSKNFFECSREEIETEKIRVIKYINGVLENLRKHSKAPIMYASFEIPINPLGGILETHSDDYQVATINYLNTYLKKKLKEYDNAYYLDINKCIAKIGGIQFYDKRYWYMARAPYSRNASKEIAFEISKYVQAINGKSKKCLVLDCDNVLWGGIIGEDGIDGIKLETEYPGLTYYDFQQTVINLYRKGVVLAICSKNNEEDVLNVLENHPKMLIKKEYISAMRINWLNKASNIQSISKELKIGLDSMVFIDDSEYEISLVNHELPEVKTIHLPKEKACNHSELLRASGFFDVLSLTDEDKERGRKYQSEKLRKNFAQKFVDLESYHRSLKIKIDVYISNEQHLNRIAQLTKRTNQFNLTTKRYSESDIKAMYLSTNVDIVSMRVQDVFGDLGIIGVCIIEYEGKEAYIDTFLMSCRALGRNLEDVLLMECLKLIKGRGIESVVAYYNPTDRNKQVESFYADRKFIPVEAETLIYRYNLDNFKYSIPDYFDNVISEIE